MKISDILSISILLAGILPVHAAKEKIEIPLTPRGQQLQEQYTRHLESLRAEVVKSLPVIDEAQKSRFLELRAQWNAIPREDSETPPAERKIIEQKREETQSALYESAAALVEALKPVLESDALDPKLMRIAILAGGTPRGLAEFAQQGAEQEKLLENLLADETLMRQVLEAGGANGGEYGEMMEVYTAIRASSERAREPGSILQRLALGTAIHMPWLNGRDKGGVYGIVQRTVEHVPQVERFLYYEKAFLDGELDPAFKDMNTWECRFITDSEYSNEELTWIRQMMRVYRPDHITTDDYKWRYTRFIKSDVPYTSTTHDPSYDLRAQMEVSLGGVCGRRAFLGRLTTRAFGIPTRASTQTAHAAMSRWTPNGWAICLGAWWSVAYCGPWGGLDFLLDSQAREFQEPYQSLVRRAQWLGDAFAEEDVSIRHGQYGMGGGFWDGLAFVNKQAIVEKAKVEVLELAGGMKLGESDELLGDEVGAEIEIPEEFRALATDADGTIMIPSVACYSPRKSSDRILLMKSWDKGYQLHYSRLGQRPELFKYRIEVPAGGEYELSAEVATVSKHGGLLIRLNHDDPVNFDIPYTKGMWATSQPLRVTLAEGLNTISVTARAPNRGVSIKQWQLKPLR